MTDKATLMRTIPRLTATLLLAAVFIAGTIAGPTTSTAGDPNQLTINGATPEQETILREITAWPGVPTLARPITINVCEGCPNMAGATGMILDDRFIPDPGHVGYVFLHEYGHIYDYQFLTVEAREAIITLHDAPYSWYGGPYMERPSERFASTFSEVAMATEGYFVQGGWATLSPPFTDIGDLSQEMQDAIVWLYDRGITKGTSVTTYSPDEPVTRGQMALFLQRALTN